MKFIWLCSSVVLTASDELLVSVKVNTAHGSAEFLASLGIKGLLASSATLTGSPGIS